MASQSFQLVMQTGPTPGKAFDLFQNDITIGRDTGNQIVINDPEISRKHAHLSLQAGSYVVEDLGSTNGTFVNGQRLMGPHVLRHGEIIMLGEKISLIFQALGFDADATLVGGGVQAGPAPVAATYRVSPQDAYAPAPAQPEYQQEYQPAFSGQVPPGPSAPYTPAAESYGEAYVAEPVEEAPKKSSKTWIYVGCGCVIIVLCCLVAAALAFDFLNLYCEPPFNTLFNC